MIKGLVLALKINTKKMQFKPKQKQNKKRQESALGPGMYILKNIIAGGRGKKIGLGPVWGKK